MDQAQALLRPGEALLAYLVDEYLTYAWVVRPGMSERRLLNIRRQDLSQAVSLLRLGLDPRRGRGVPRLEQAAGELRGAERLKDGRSVVGLFDVDRAHALYEQVWAPLEPYLKGVEHVLVVPARIW